MIKELFGAVKAGQELKNPEKWKKGQVLTNLVGAIVTGAIVLIKWKFPDLPIPDEIKDYAIEIIGGALVVANLYLTPATTKKIGA